MRAAVYFLFMLPLLVNAPLEVYFIDSVLKYRFKNRKLAYITASIISVTTAVLSLVFCVDTTGRIVITLPYDLISIAASLCILVMMLVNMKEKFWIKIVVFFLSASMLDTFFHIFTASREIIYSSLTVKTHVLRVVALLVIAVLMTLLEIGIFILIDKIRSKHDDTPLPIRYLLAFFLVVELFEVVFALQTTEYSYSTEYDVMDFSSLNSSQLAMLIFTLLAGLMAVIVLFYIRATKEERDTLKELNSVNEELVASQTRYYEATVKADSEIRAIRHDMKNNVQVLKILLGNKEYDQMEKYLSELTEKLQGTEISAHTGDVIADAVICAKKAEAEEHGITVSTSGVISDIHITPQDMCQILSNILDNAIEAASDERLRDLNPAYKKIVLELKKTDRFFLISATNPCAEKVNIVNGMVKTSKEDSRNHGFGLRNIRSAAENYDGELTLSCEGKPYGYEFRLDIIFPLLRFHKPAESM